jgi:subtilisin family serine protease
MYRSSKNRLRLALHQLTIETLEDRALLAFAPFVADEILVKFKDGFGENERASVRAAVHATHSEGIETDAMRAAGYRGLELLKVPANVSAAIVQLQRNPMVEYAEPNWIYSHQAVSNDPYFTNGSLWGMYGDASSPANAFGSQAAEAWSAGYTGSSDIYVGIIDEGVNFQHPDLLANVWTNPFDLVDGIDNDGNGRVDDINGWDFNGNDNTVYDGRSDDHGTHVAGTIAAKGGNAAGVVGVNWNVKYISAKFLGANGGTTANAIKAVDYMTDLKTRHNLNIVATNNSWGGGGYSQSLLDAINRGGKADILFVAAAGNSGLNTDVSLFYPAGYESDAIISVAAINNTGGLASFSNYGIKSVDIGAPGVDIYSTLPNNKYGSYNGTSMAAPHVTGAAALYASTHPGASAAAIKSAIINTATPTASLAGKTVTGGRLNVGALMNANGPVTPSLTISDVMAIEGDTGTTPFSFTVSLSAASSTVVTVYYATSLETADNEDLDSLPPDQLLFEAGETSKTISVNVRGDTVVESNETFFVNLSSAVGASIAVAQGKGTIVNDDATAAPSLTIGDYQDTEGNSGTKQFTFVVTLSEPSTSIVTVNYATANGTAKSSGKAKDFTAASGTINFPVGATTMTIIVAVLGDTTNEVNETFFVNLSSAVGATLEDNQATGTILNDDGSAAALANKESDTFSSLNALDDIFADLDDSFSLEDLDLFKKKAR